MLQTHSLHPGTQAVFHWLAASELAAGFLLIGGTALALHIAHRMSNDLDFLFCEPNGKLPTGKIDRLLGQLRMQGRKVDWVTDTAQESAFRINTGERLSDYARDYTIDGVKVTFFTASPQQHPRRFEFWRSAPRSVQPGCAFAVLSLDALKSAKTLVLQDRVRSRDLFDLMVLMRDHAYTPEALFDTVMRWADGAQDGEVERLILRGLIPLDKRDEGLESIGVDMPLSEIYQFFNTRLTEYEAGIHAGHLLAARNKR